MVRMEYVYWIILVLLGITNERISGKKFIEFLEEPSDITVPRNTPAELRCSVSGANSNTEIYWFKDGKQLDLSQDKRRTIQPQGSLKFSSIIKQKKVISDEGVYQCVGKTTNNGNVFKIVSRKAKLTVAVLSKSFSVPPSNVTVNQGETAVFKCKVKRSRPTAKISWSLDGKNTDLTLNFRFVVLPSGTLEIRSVLTSDAGVYVCKTTNELTGKSVTATAVLTVKPASVVAKPSQFLVKPRSVTLLHNEDLILECIVTGYPRKRVTWFIDGRQLTLSNSGHYTQFGTDNLKVTTVQPQDSGKYECVIGKLRAQASVQVMVPPRFTMRPQDVTEKENENIKLTCAATGHPKPQIMWYYNGDVVTDLDFIMVVNQSLLVKGIMDSDSGMYQCFASNNAGEIQASAQLVVSVEVPSTTPPPPFTTPPPSTTTHSTTMDPTTTDLITTHPTTTHPTTTHPITTHPITTHPITLATTQPPTPDPTTIISSKGPTPSAPKNVVARALGTTSIAVSWDPPDNPNGLILNYTVVTTSVSTGQLVPTMPSTSERVIKIDNLNPGTKYNFVVFATNANGRGIISRYAAATTKELPPPIQTKTGPPRDVKVEAVDSMALKVSWKEPGFISSPIQNYTIHYQDVHQNIRVMSKTSMTLQVVLLKLQPYTEYNIQVTAFSTNGLGKTAAPVTGKTKSGIPKGPPENVKLTEMGGILVAEWRKPFNPNGNITGYFLKLKNVNTGQVVVSTTVVETQKMFTKVEKSTTYAFRVAAVTEAGRGSFSKWKKIAMPPKRLTEDRLPGMPTNLNTRVLQGMVQVTWDPPAERHIIVRRYVLNYGRGAPGQKDIKLSNTTRKYLLKKLQPGSFYIVRVRAANKNGQGKEAMDRVDIPYGGTVPRPVSGLSNLRAIPIKNRTLELSWSDSLFTLHPDVVYNIKYRKNNQLVYVNTTAQTYVVKHLRPGSLYTFSIKRDNQAVYPKVQVVQNWTREEVPSIPKDVTVSIDAELGYVMVQWNSPDERNGHLINYKICWTPKKPKNWTCKTVKGHTLNERISGIKDNVTYLVKIRARNKAGDGVFSKEKEFYGKHLTSVMTAVNNKNVDSTDEIETDLENDTISKIKKEPTQKTLGDETLWIVIAVIAAVTLIAIVVISVILCKKRSRGGGGVGFSPPRKKPKSDPYKAVANGGAKKKTKENYWIKQNTMELESYPKGNNTAVVAAIPRNADEMKPLDSPFQSRKNPNSYILDESDQESVTANGPSSFAGDNPSGLPEPYKPLPTVAPKPINIYQSPFPHESDDFPEPPPEVVGDKFDDGPATSSDYGSEEIVAPSPTLDEPPVSYLPKKSPNGYVSVATDYDLPPKIPQEKADETPDNSALQNLMRDLDAIMAKEDRV